MKISKNFLNIALFGLSFLSASVSYLIITSFPKLAESFTLNNFQLGTIISSYFLMSAIFIFFWIYLLGKYSKVKIILINSFIWISGAILFSFSQNYYHLLIFSAIMGSCIEASSILILLILLQMISKSYEGKLFSLFLIIQGLGALFGAFITSYLAESLGYDWNYVFLFIGGLSLIWTCVSGLMMLRFKKLKTVTTEDLDKIGYDFNLKSTKSLFKNKTNSFLIIWWLYSVPIIFFFNIWTQIYFQDYHALTQMEATLSYVFLSGGEFIGMIIGGWIYDRLYSKEHYKKILVPITGMVLSIPLLFIGFILFWEKELSIVPNEDLFSTAINLFGFAISSFSVFVSYVSLFMGFILFALIYPFFFVAINDCNNEFNKSVMLGIRSLILIVGQVISPLIGGLIIDLSSTLIVMLIVPIFLIIPTIHLFLMRKEIEKEFLSNLKIESIENINSL
jgi:MFS family permease